MAPDFNIQIIESEPACKFSYVGYICLYVVATIDNYNYKK